MATILGGILTILGHGIDVVDLPDFRRMIELRGNAFIDRCYSPLELSLAKEVNDRLEFLAGRFAAKEAILKAMFTGQGNGISLTDIEIGKNAVGAPEVTLHHGALKAAEALFIDRWHLSISHTEQVVFASAIAVGVMDRYLN